MAALFPLPVDRYHSDVWWMVRTGLTEAECIERKNALLSVLREKWPDPKDVEKSDKTYWDIIDAIDHVVVGFDDKKWLLPEESDPMVRYSEQLRLYFMWATEINVVRQSMSPEAVFTTRSEVSSGIKEIFTADHPFASHFTRNNTGTTGEPAASYETFDYANVAMNVRVLALYRTGATFPLREIAKPEALRPYSVSDFTIVQFERFLLRQGFIGSNIQDYCIHWWNGQKWCLLEHKQGQFENMLEQSSGNPNETPSLIHVSLQKLGGRFELPSPPTLLPRFRKQ